MRLVLLAASSNALTEYLLSLRKVSSRIGMSASSVPPWFHTTLHTRKKNESRTCRHQSARQACQRVRVGACCYRLVLLRNVCALLARIVRAAHLRRSCVNTQISESTTTVTREGARERGSERAREGETDGRERYGREPVVGTGEKLSPSFLPPADRDTPAGLASVSEKAD